MVTISSGNEEPRSISGAPQLWGNDSLPSYYSIQNDDGDIDEPWYFPIGFDMDVADATCSSLWLYSKALEFVFTDPGRNNEFYVGDLGPAPKLDITGNVRVPWDVYVDGDNSTYKRFVILHGASGPAHSELKGDWRRHVEVVLYNDSGNSYPIEIRTGGNVEISFEDSFISDSTNSTSGQTDFTIGDGESVVLTNDGSPYSVHNSSHVTGTNIDPLAVGEVPIDYGADNHSGNVFRQVNVYDDSDVQSAGENRSLRVGNDGSVAVVPVGTGLGDIGLRTHDSSNEPINRFMKTESETHTTFEHYALPGRGNSGPNNNLGVQESSDEVSTVSDTHQFDVDNGTFYNATYIVFHDGSDNVFSLQNLDQLRVGVEPDGADPGVNGWYLYTRDDSGNWSRETHFTWNYSGLEVTEVSLSSKNVSGFVVVPEEYIGNSYSVTYPETPQGFWRDVTFGVEY